MYPASEKLSEVISGQNEAVMTFSFDWSDNIDAPSHITFMTYTALYACKYIVFKMIYDS